MKKIIPILTGLGLVLGVGLAFAGENTLYNGVTYFETVNKDIQCSSEGGMAAGGMAAEEVSKDVIRIMEGGIKYTSPNGVSFVSETPILTCSWARGLGRDLKLHNGVSFPG